MRPSLCPTISRLGRLRLSVADARDLAEGALRGIGYHNDEARIIADHVIEAAGKPAQRLAEIAGLREMTIRKKRPRDFSPGEHGLPPSWLFARQSTTRQQSELGLEPQGRALVRFPALPHTAVPFWVDSPADSGSTL